MDIMDKKVVCMGCGHSFYNLAAWRYGGRCPCCGSFKFEVDKR